MPLYSFQKQFVPYINDGTKKQTIRKIRKHPPKIGQPVTLVTGSRFKPVKIGFNNNAKWVSKVDTIFILPNGNVYLIEDNTLNEGSKALMLDNPKVFKEYKNSICLDDFNKDLLAYNDGFRNGGECVTGCFEKMFNWFKATQPLPFVGHITYWKYADDLPF